MKVIGPDSPFATYGMAPIGTLEGPTTEYFQFMVLIKGAKPCIPRGEAEYVQPEVLWDVMMQ